MILITIMVIMNRYTKMYGWLYNIYGNTTFTIDDFKMTFPSPQPVKIIHDLIRLKYMKRVKRGKYQIIKPEDYVKRIVKENLDTEDILKESDKKYAFTNSTAVNIWTDGTYLTGFTKGFKPIHIQILKKDTKHWNDFFKKNNAEYVLEGENKTLFGLTYILHPKDSFNFEIKDDNFVVPLREIIKYCQKNIYLYRPALEYIERKYNLF